MSEPSVSAALPGAGLLEIYDDALRHVYGYLLSRCDGRAVAEDLTEETFLAAVDAVRGQNPPAMSTGWLIGVARHKLADHWRRQARDNRALRALASDPSDGREYDDPWDAQLDAMRARDTLSRLAPHHRLALTLRYLDDLPVPEVAHLLDRTLHATEALLVRARVAFRRAYTGEGEEM